MKKLLLYLVIISSIFAKQYSVDELVIEALQNSPDIAISKLDLNASKSRSSQAFSGYLPQIDLYGSLEYINANDMPFQNKNISDTLYNGTITLKQLLYDFGKTSGSYQSTKKNVQLFDATLAEKILQKKKEVKIAYYELLKQYALIEVAKESIKLNEAQLYRAKRYFEAGIRTKVDISDAKVQLLQAQIRLENAQYDLKNAYATLDRVVGFKNITSYSVIQPNLEDFLQISLPKVEKTLQECIDFAYENRPKLLQYLYNYQAQRELQKSVDATYYPQIYLTGGYLKTKAKKYNTLLDQDQYSAAINLNWNLYGGGRDKARKQEQTILVQKALQEEYQTKLLIKEEVTKAFIAVQKSKKQIELAHNLLTLSSEKFMQVTKQYEHGLSDYIELQVARQGYIDAKSNLVINLYNYYIALALLKATIGQ